MVVVQVLVGWPAILGSLLLSAIGIARRHPGLVIAGSVLVTGFSWLYLSGWPQPTLKLLGYVLPFTHLAAALAVRLRMAPWVAWLMLVPHAGVAAYLAVIVLSQ